MYDKIGVTLEGGLLEDASANHVFMAMQLQDLPAALQRQVDRGSNRHAVRNDDVVCLVKKYIGDPEPGQKPLLVFTEAQASRIPNIPVDKHPRRVVSDTVKVQWQKLATAVEQYYGDSYNLQPNTSVIWSMATFTTTQSLKTFLGFKLMV
ncbi:unnamed protein product [Cladocopium goreaui]|uniref:Uncharacterized protein n=1 Tax=Cladocopium goreaui TaxID=2562237 RepID=A0A9P1CVC4_9DINO|nr:unnamed protein product [Cladocopium goreaui]